MSKRFRLLLSVVCSGAFAAGYGAFSSGSPYFLILVLSVAFGCLIGGVMGCWPYLARGRSSEVPHVLSGGDDAIL